MADYLSIGKMEVPFDSVKIEKLHRITGETQRYRMKVGFYTQETEIIFCLTEDEAKSLMRQMESII